MSEKAGEMKSFWILVETNKRSYCVQGHAKVAWERGETVIRIEPIGSH